MLAVVELIQAKFLFCRAITVILTPEEVEVVLGSAVSDTITFQWPVRCWTLASLLGVK